MRLAGSCWSGWPPRSRRQHSVVGWPTVAEKGPSRRTNTTVPAERGQSGWDSVAGGAEARASRPATTCVPATAHDCRWPGTVAGCRQCLIVTAATHAVYSRQAGAAGPLTAAALLRGGPLQGDEVAEGAQLPAAWLQARAARRPLILAAAVVCPRGPAVPAQVQRPAGAPAGRALQQLESVCAGRALLLRVPLLRALLLGCRRGGHAAAICLPAVLLLLAAVVGAGGMLPQGGGCHPALLPAVDGVIHRQHRGLQLGWQQHGSVAGTGVASIALGHQQEGGGEARARVQAGRQQPQAIQQAARQGKAGLRLQRQPGQLGRHRQVGRQRELHCDATRGQLPGCAGDAERLPHRGGQHAAVAALAAARVLQGGRQVQGCCRTGGPVARQPCQPPQVERARGVARRWGRDVHLIRRRRHLACRPAREEASTALASRRPCRC